MDGRFLALGAVDKGRAGVSVWRDGAPTLHYHTRAAVTVVAVDATGTVAWTCATERGAPAGHRTRLLQARKRVQLQAELARVNLDVDFKVQVCHELYVHEDNDGYVPNHKRFGEHPLFAC